MMTPEPSQIQGKNKGQDNVFVTSQEKNHRPHVIFDTTRITTIPNAEYTGPNARKFRHLSKVIKFSVVTIVVVVIVVTAYFLAREEAREFLEEERKLHDDIRNFIFNHSETSFNRELGGDGGGGRNIIIENKDGEEAKEGKNCEPGKVYKRGCNTCKCDAEGEDLECTKMLCTNGASFKLMI